MYKITTDVLCAGQYVIHVNGNGMEWKMTIPDDTRARSIYAHTRDLVNGANRIGRIGMDKETLIKRLNAWRAVIQ